MKLLEIHDLDSINSAIASLEFNDGSRLYGRAETYSCKAAGNDKKLLKHLESKYSRPVIEESMEEEEGHGMSPGKRKEPSIVYEDSGLSLRMLYYMISTMNMIFEDYDFSDMDPKYFYKVNLKDMIVKVNAAFCNCGWEGFKNIKLWDTLDKVIELNDCQIFSFDPEDPDIENPFSCDDIRGVIWSFNYFIWNRKLKRLVVFYCRLASIPDGDASQGSTGRRSVTPF